MARGDGYVMLTPNQAQAVLDMMNDNSDFNSLDTLAEKYGHQQAFRLVSVKDRIAEHLAKHKAKSESDD